MNEKFYGPIPGAPVPAATPVPGYAMVRKDRDVQLASGRSSLRFSDVAGLIDPTTVTFTVPANAGVRVLEQNFQFDLVSTPKLLLRYLDRPITVERNVGNESASVAATLLSAVVRQVPRRAGGTVQSPDSVSAVHIHHFAPGLF